MAERAVPIFIRETRPLREGVSKFLEQDPESLRRKLSAHKESVAHHERQVEFQTKKLAGFGVQTDANFTDVASTKSDLRWHQSRLAKEVRVRGRLESRLGGTASARIAAE